MSSYESIFITKPSLMEEEVNRLGDRLKSMIEEGGGSVQKTENWGKKKLAYEVAKEKKGNYFFLSFQADGQVIRKLERAYRLDDAVMKYMTVRLTKQDFAQRELVRKKETQSPQAEGGPQGGERAGAKQAQSKPTEEAAKAS